MPRYFIEVSYLGTRFSGFQNQIEGITIQGSINHALRIILKEDIETTTSSRTDAGVHANQNFLHFDYSKSISAKSIYNLNAVLPEDIVVHAIYPVNDTAHARFDALSRTYHYYIIQEKNPFLKETSYFYPFALQLEQMNEAAKLLVAKQDFETFAKRNSDVNNFICTIEYAFWHRNEHGQIVFEVKSNRFLRGMVRGLVGTQLLLGRGKISLDEFKNILFSKDCTQADFSAHASGLFLRNVNYPPDLLNEIIKQ